MKNQYLIQPTEAQVFHASPTETITFWVTGKETDNAFTYLEAVFGHLDGPPLHIHTQEDEWVHVISGEIRCKVGDDMFDAQAGEVLILPRNVPHTFTNLKQEPARVIGVVNNDFYEFYSALATQTKENPDPTVLSEISARFGIKIMGPPLAKLLQSA